MTVSDFFEKLMAKYLPYVDVRAATPSSDQSDKSKKRKKEQNGRKSPSTKGRKSPGIAKTKRRRSSDSRSEPMELANQPSEPTGQPSEPTGQPSEPKGQPTGQLEDDMGPTEPTGQVAESSGLTVGQAEVQMASGHSSPDNTSAPMVPPRPKSADAALEKRKKVKVKLRRASHESKASQYSPYRSHEARSHLPRSHLPRSHETFNRLPASPVHQDDEVDVEAKDGNTLEPRNDGASPDTSECLQSLDPLPTESPEQNDTQPKLAPQMSVKFSRVNTKPHK